MISSIVIASGSTALNSHVRINCLWRCINSLHNEPGGEFEIILIDNSVTRDHREAIDRIYDTYSTVTHVIRNRVNERHGGAMRQGMHCADGEIIITMADDVVVFPGWLEVLYIPLIYTEKKYISVLQRGPNVRGNPVNKIKILGRTYIEYNRAGHYVWAMRREDAFRHGWKRKHFADTRRVIMYINDGFVFPAPEQDRYIQHTNLNYLRPWVYKAKFTAYRAKMAHLENIWQNQGRIVMRKPVFPTETFPLRGLPSEQELEEKGEKWRHIAPKV